MIKNRPVLFRTLSRIFQCSKQDGSLDRAGKFSFSMSSSNSSSKERPYTVIVEGNIGSGKTTFLEPFTTGHPDVVEVLAEPVSLRICVFDEILKNHSAPVSG